MTSRKIRKNFNNPASLKEEIRSLQKELATTRSALEAIISGQADAVIGLNCPYILKAKEAEEEVRKLLQEKDALIKEIHHRVKNNLQIVLSMINLQMNSEQSKEIRERLLVLYNRIKTMAAIHEVFYRTDYMSSLNLAEYLETIVVHLFTVYRVDEKRINLVKEMESLSVSINTAIPLGLMVNELVTNSLQHAFEGRPAGEVRMKLRSIDGENCQLLIEDDGKGLPPDINWEKPSTLGLEMVKLLAGQIDARINRVTGPGTSFEILFKRS